MIIFGGLQNKRSYFRRLRTASWDPHEGFIPIRSDHRDWRMIGTRFFPCSLRSVSPNTSRPSFDAAYAENP